MPSIQRTKTETIGNYFRIHLKNIFLPIRLWRMTIFAGVAFQILEIRYPPQIFGGLRFEAHFRRDLEAKSQF